MKSKLEKKSNISVKSRQVLDGAPSFKGTIDEKLMLAKTEAFEHFQPAFIKTATKWQPPFAGKNRHKITKPLLQLARGALFNRRRTNQQVDQ